MDLRPTILTEEEYTSSIEKIIRRDFFPDLPKMELQAELLEARQAGDIERYRAILVKYQKYQKGSTPMVASGNASQAPPSNFSSPASFSSSFTPIIKGIGGVSGRGGGENSVNEADGSATKTQTNTTMSLDAFLLTHVSEDDKSFEVLLEKQNATKKVKNAWMHDTNGPQPLLIEGSKDDRPNLLEGWNFTPKNSLMYYPDGLKPDIPSVAPKREINHGATRLFKVPTEPVRPRGSFASSSANSTPSLDPLKRLIDIKDPSSKFDLDEMRKTPGEWAREAEDKSAYPLVATPSPMPGSGGDSPFLTWGEIEGTPLALDPSSSPMNGPSFRIAETPKRDQLAMKLSDDASRKMRDRDQRAQTLLMKQAITKGGIKSPQLLSPAAKKLAQATRTNSLKGSDSQLRQSYNRATPSPRNTPNSRTSSNGRQSSQTPQHSGNPATPAPVVEASVTDDLLNL